MRVFRHNVGIYMKRAQRCEDEKESLVSDNGH